MFKSDGNVIHFAAPKGKMATLDVSSRRRRQVTGLFADII